VHDGLDVSIAQLTEQLPVPTSLHFLKVGEHRLS